MVARAGQVGARDLFGGQPADFAQGQRDPRVGRQRRMAAGEDQPELVVADLLRLGELGLGLGEPRQVRQGGGEPARRRQRSMVRKRPVETSHA